jgi:branched-chain amino acid transport system substrate-binding protein
MRITPRSSAAAIVISLLVALMLVALPLPSDHSSISAEGGQPPAGELTLGALLGLTGGATTLGRTSQAALQLATEDINAELLAAGSPLHIRIAIADTQLLPATALQQAQSLAGQGIQVAIGPQTSSEAAAIKPWADANGFLVLSNGSTASSLSIRDDNVLRFVPDDSHEIEAETALLQHDGIKAVVPLWRDDAGNRGLHDSLVRLFPASGGVVLDGASYAVDAADYTQPLATVSSQVQQAQQQFGPNAVAVMLASFEEAVQVFHAAQNDPVLSSVRWYGTDGVAQSVVLLRDAQARAFTQKVGFPCANLGLDQGAKGIWQPLSDRINAAAGIVPDTSAFAAYDAAWVATLAYLESGAAPSSSALRQTIANFAGRYYGATGRTLLNAAGDRASGNYDFWSIRDEAGSPRWVISSTYQTSPGGSGRIVDTGG